LVRALASQGADLAPLAVDGDLLAGGGGAAPIRHHGGETDSVLARPPLIGEADSVRCGRRSPVWVTLQDGAVREAGRSV
jgi:hypothetical protein